tara:strand:- start:202 stop:372 length:171 start_codon:yes stop_codon:yes gene_type:complete
MVGPRRTGRDKAEAAGGDLWASKHASAGAGGAQQKSATARLVDALGVEVCAQGEGA